MKRVIALAALVLSLAPLPAAAQETDTEKAAARDVLRKMAELEQSLDVPGLVAQLTGPNAARDAVVARAKELLETELLAMADDIATHPEVGFIEKRSVEKLTGYLRRHNFEVETGVANLPTAFVATFHGSDADRRARFEREAQAVASLSHPNVIAIFDTGDHDGQIYLVMELLAGRTLRERLSSGPLPVRKAVDIAVKIARGLGAAHGKGIVHRDLKPENTGVLQTEAIYWLPDGRGYAYAFQRDLSQVFVVRGVR